MDDLTIARQRLRSQHLTGPPLASPEQVVGHLGAVQAQEYALAKWSVGQRAEGVDDAAVDRALADGTIVRTHLLRPTWHFVQAADLRWLMALSAPRVHQQNGHMYRQTGVDQVDAATDALLSGALGRGGRLTRAELGKVLGAEGMRLSYLLMRAELDLVICSGGLRGRQQTYALVDERVPQAPPISRDEALAELTRRYFTSHGPATVKDFVAWSGLTGADVRRGLEMAADLEQVRVGDRAYWAADLSAVEAAPPRVHLIQLLEEYIMGYRESRDVMAPLPGETVPREVALLDGRMIGRWQRTSTRTAITVEVRTERPLDAAGTDSLDAEVDRLGRFFGLTATWSAI